MFETLALAAALHAYCVPPRDTRGRIARSNSAVTAFKREQACPATGSVRGVCRGWVVDHVVPLKRCGADLPSNMQWQTLGEARAKDRWE